MSKKLNKNIESSKKVRKTIKLAKTKKVRPGFFESIGSYGALEDMELDHVEYFPTSHPTTSNQT